MGSILVGVTDAPLSAETLTRALPACEDGALLVFSGVVRNRNDGRPVLAVTYDAHVPLAESTFREIGEEARARWGVDLGVVVAHRTGRLAVGEVSTVIAVASPHRDEAYQASRYVIEQLKLRSPIWKQEHYADGDSAWLDGRPLRAGGEGDGARGPARRAS
jgi:molybdopterin synthase catalytic subunit